jgi:hypothetical protein
VTQALDVRRNSVEIDQCTRFCESRGNSLSEDRSELVNRRMPRPLEIALERGLKKFYLLRTDSSYLLEPDPVVPVFDLVSVHGFDLPQCVTF